MSGPYDEFIPTRRSLLTRLKHWDDQQGWQEFFDTYWKLLYSVARKAGLGPDDAEDIVQETIVAVARRMPDFRYDPALGSFKSWLLTVIRRRIIDRFRHRGRRPAPASPPSRLTARTATVEKIPDPNEPMLERVWDEEWEHHRRDAALARVKRQVSAKQFQIFDCYAIKNWPVAEVVKHLGVTEQQVYMAKHRVGELLKEQLGRVETGTF
jgi:RNA polymerase sigma-70 factor (ECF subfamily)